MEAGFLHGYRSAGLWLGELLDAAEERQTMGSEELHVGRALVRVLGRKSDALEANLPDVDVGSLADAMADLRAGIVEASDADQQAALVRLQAKLFLEDDPSPPPRFDLGEMLARAREATKIAPADVLAWQGAVDFVNAIGEMCSLLKLQMDALGTIAALPLDADDTTASVVRLIDGMRAASSVVQGISGQVHDATASASDAAGLLYLEHRVGALEHRLEQWSEGTARSVARLVLGVHPSPSWRLDFCGRLLQRLCNDARHCGYPVAAAWLTLVKTAVADVCSVGERLDADLAELGTVSRGGAHELRTAAGTSPHDMPRQHFSEAVRQAAMVLLHGTATLGDASTTRKKGGPDAA